MQKLLTRSKCNIFQSLIERMPFKAHASTWCRKIVPTRSTQYRGKGLVSHGINGGVRNLTNVPGPRQLRTIKTTNQIIGKRGSVKSQDGGGTVIDNRKKGRTVYRVTRRPVTRVLIQCAKDVQIKEKKESDKSNTLAMEAKTEPKVALDGEIGFRRHEILKGDGAAESTCNKIELGVKKSTVKTVSRKNKLSALQGCKNIDKTVDTHALFIPKPSSLNKILLKRKTKLQDNYEKRLQHAVTPKRSVRRSMKSIRFDRCATVKSDKNSSSLDEDKLTPIYKKTSTTPKSNFIPEDTLSVGKLRVVSPLKSKHVIKCKPIGLKVNRREKSSPKKIDLLEANRRESNSESSAEANSIITTTEIDALKPVQNSISSSNSDENQTEKSRDQIWKFGPDSNLKESTGYETVKESDDVILHKRVLSKRIRNKMEMSYLPKNEKAGLLLKPGGSDLNWKVDKVEVQPRLPNSEDKDKRLTAPAEQIISNAKIQRQMSENFLQFKPHSELMRGDHVPRKIEGPTEIKVKNTENTEKDTVKKEPLNIVEASNSKLDAIDMKITNLINVLSPEKDERKMSSSTHKLNGDNLQLLESLKLSPQKNKLAISSTVDKRPSRTILGKPKMKNDILINSSFTSILNDDGKIKLREKKHNKSTILPNYESKQLTVMSDLSTHDWRRSLSEMPANKIATIAPIESPLSQLSNQLHKNCAYVQSNDHKSCAIIRQPELSKLPAIKPPSDLKSYVGAKMAIIPSCEATNNINPENRHSEHNFIMCSQHDATNDCCQKPQDSYVKSKTHSILDVSDMPKVPIPIRINCLPKVKPPFPPKRRENFVCDKIRQTSKSSCQPGKGNVEKFSVDWAMELTKYLQTKYRSFKTLFAAVLVDLVAKIKTNAVKALDGHLTSSRVKSCRKIPLSARKLKECRITPVLRKGAILKKKNVNRKRYVKSIKKAALDHESKSIIAEEEDKRKNAGSTTNPTLAYSEVLNIVFRNRR